MDGRQRTEGERRKSEPARHFSELRGYRAAFRLQQNIFKATLTFPKEERYSLTDQVRRSSRAVGANIAEAWQKRRYEAHFLSKLSDADAELAETEHWLLTSRVCEYVSEAVLAELRSQAREVGHMLGAMIRDPKPWCRRRSAD